MLIDTHSHLYTEEFDQDRDQVVRRALEGNVGRIILPAIDSSSHGRLTDMSVRYPGVCFPLMGLHPTSVNDNPRWREELALVEGYLEGATAKGGMKFYGVGEIGLDLYWSKDHLADQREALRAQIEMALRHALPIVVHMREAWPEIIELLGEYKGRGLRGVMHSFSGTAADYRDVLLCGDFLFGIGGPVTYKKSSLAQILPMIGPERLVLETDSPYLPPVPYRGKRNESSYLPIICARVAELLGVTEAEVERTTTANAVRMFALEE